LCLGQSEGTQCSALRYGRSGTDSNQVVVPPTATGLLKAWYRRNN